MNRSDKEIAETLTSILPSEFNLAHEGEESGIIMTQLFDVELVIELHVVSIYLKDEGVGF